MNICDYNISFIKKLARFLRIKAKSKTVSSTELARFMLVSFHFQIWNRDLMVPT